MFLLDYLLLFMIENNLTSIFSESYKLLKIVIIILMITDEVKIFFLH